MNDEYPALGQLLRNLRTRNGWTLKEMSAEIGIPFSTLSKVENGRLTLSYEKLLQISQRLDIRLSELIAEFEQSAHPPITARRSIATVDRSVRVETPNYDYHYLCPELRRKQMIPILLTVRARSIEEFGPLIRHAGEEYHHVLRGRVVVHTEFYDPVTLEEGEGIYIDSNMGHAYILAKGCEKAEVLGMCSSSDEDALAAHMGHVGATED